MQVNLFFRFGQIVNRFRWPIIIFWLIIVLSCIPFTSKIMDPFKDIGFIDSKSESAQANDILNDKLGYSYNQFIVMYHSKKLLATNPSFQEKIKNSLARLKDLPAKPIIIYPTTENKQISKDKHTAYAAILFKGDQEAGQKILADFKAKIKKPSGLNMRIGGEPIFLDDAKIQTQTDLFKAEYIATPVAIIMMLIVFGTVVAASLPIILGAVGAFIILMALFCLGHVFSLSVFTINIAILLGVCLSLDYALLIINRYRDELELGRNPADAIAVTQATAGQAVFFSGMAVFISLSALLLFRVNILFSVGIGGLAAVSVAVLIALMLLPAILAVLKHRINYLPIFKIKRAHGNPYCRWLVSKVVKRPYIYFTAILITLLFLGHPFLNVKLGISDFRILPKHLESRQVFDQFSKEFGESRLSPVLAILETAHDNILSHNNIDYLYDFADRVMDDKRIDEVKSIVSTDPRLTKAQYQALYSQSKKLLPPDVKKLLDVTTNGNLTLMTIVSKTASDSSKTTDFIKELRLMDPGNHITLAVTGSAANTVDVLDGIGKMFPYALLWIVGFTYLILLILLRSVVLPLKAILTTILSLFASYGVLVLVIQQGFLHNLLNFEPQGMLDISLLIIIFCALFGISMDYEVFLLTRIKEYYEQTGDTYKSIISGIDRSWKIITSAAIIVILICFSFMSADVIMVKAFGLGIAVAVFVDAYIIRTLLVPATMAILNKWNWYLPKWLDRILPKISFDPEHYLIK